MRVEQDYSGALCAVRHLNWLGGDNYEYQLLIGVVIEQEESWPHKLKIMFNGKILYVDKVELQLVWFQDDTPDGSECILNDRRLNNLLKQIEYNLNKPR
jgi:hypothetical protein